MKVLKFECLNRVRSFVFIALIFVFSLKSYGLNFYQIQGSMRSFPQSGSIEGRYYFNEKLWSQESEGAPWKYGFWRVGAMAAAHGLAGVSIEVSPISLWQIILQNSVTSRFYDTKTVDCKMFECRGWITRGTLKTSFLLGRTFNTLGLFFIPSFEVSDLNLNTKSKNFSSETDNIVAHQEGDQITSLQWALGFKKGVNRWALVSKESKMKITKDFNKSLYLIWNNKKDESFSYFLGAGTFESTYAKKSASFVGGLSWSVGDNVSLF